MIIKKILHFTILINYLYAQVYPPFVNTSKNKIYYDKDSNNFYAFKRKIEELKQKKRKHITIIHFGGSHVQGGFWSESIMYNLQKKLGTKGGGYYVFPFKQVNTNTPYYFKTYSNVKWKVNKCTKITDTLQCPGMCGISAITDTTGYLAIKNSSEALNGFTKVKLFYRANSDYVIIPQFVTSNITHHDYYTEYILSQISDSIAFIIQKKDGASSEFILDGISCENQDAGVYYAGFGVNGATSESFLKCALLSHQLKSLNVDLFILSFGVNDVRNQKFSKEKFFNNYDTLIKILKSTHPNASILITTISDNYIKRKTHNKHTIEGNTAIFNIMKKYQIAIWDLHSVMGGKKSMYQWFKAGYSAKDKIHFNKKGYSILGQLMVDAFFLPIESFDYQCTKAIQ